MSTPAPTTPVGPSPTRRTKKRRSGFSTFVSVTGEVLITVGVLLLLFVAWQLWWTDFLSAREHEAGRNSLLQEWGINQTSEPPQPVDPKYGKAFGLVYIPELKNRAWGVPLIEGTSREELMRGFGHHPTSAVPGELGNFAMAAHRTTYGAPLSNIDTLKRGDLVIIETKFGWYTYELTNQKIIKPWDGWILDPVPGLPRDEVPTEALMTMYSCHPKYSAAERYVWFGKLIAEDNKADGPPAAIQEKGGV